MLKQESNVKEILHDIDYSYTQILDHCFAFVTLCQMSCWDTLGGFVYT